MKYFFSGADNHIIKAGARNILLSYATHKNAPKHFAHRPEFTLIIDSGAFTVWNTGGTINIDDYIAYCKLGSPDWTYINLDVIPQTGSTKAQIEEAVEKSKQNFLYIKKHGFKVMPVFHYGENLDVLKWYMNHTDYIGISPANDTHEKVKREFLDTVFSVTRDKCKCHGLGYSSFEGLTKYPFYSVDSISFRRTKMDDLAFFNSNKKLMILQKQSVAKFMKYEAYVTELWKERGIEWQ